MNLNCRPLLVVICFIGLACKRESVSFDPKLSKTSYGKVTVSFSNAGNDSLVINGYVVYDTSYADVFNYSRFRIVDEKDKNKKFELRISDQKLPKLGKYYSLVNTSDWNNKSIVDKAAIIINDFQASDSLSSQYNSFLASKDKIYLSITGNTIGIELLKTPLVSMPMADSSKPILYLKASYQANNFEFQ